METGEEYEFISTNMKLAASTIATICKTLWHNELFFQWIRQNLNIK